MIVIRAGRYKSALAVRLDVHHINLFEAFSAEPDALASDPLADATEAVQCMKDPCTCLQHIDELFVALGGLAWLEHAAEEAH